MTLNYGKWSLSGSHLMLVIACNYNADISIADGTTLFRIDDIPNWVVQKVYPILGNLIIYQKASLIHEDWTRGEKEFYLAKVYDVLRIYNNGAITDSKAGMFRLRFDLLIDTD